MKSSHTYKPDTQIMKEQLSTKVVWLETEDFEQACVISETNFNKTEEISQWQIYLNALAQIGFQRYLKERNPNITINQDNPSKAFDNICYLIINGFSFCLIILDNLVEQFVSIPTQLITSSQKTAQFYVLLEVLEEEQQLNIHGFLRYDELFKYSQKPDLKSLSEDSYQVPLSLFDTELNNLLLYARFLSPSAIKLPVAVTSNTVTEALTEVKNKVDKVLVDLSKWWTGIFEEGWQSTEFIWNAIPNNLAWGYVRSRNESNSFLISRTKLFDLGLLLQNKPFALTVNLKPENEEQGVLVQILPHQEQYLPSGLKLKVTLNTNTPESISQEVVARKADNAIQLEFSEAAGKQFQVEVSYQDAVITEAFVL